MPTDAETPEVVSVPMGRWAVASSPARIRTLLGSCVGVVLYDRQSRAGGVAHVVLPESRGAAEHPGKFADTAIPALLADLRRLARAETPARLTAKLVGGASMFPGGREGAIGRANAEAAGRILRGLGIAVIARDLGGEQGRRLTLDTATGAVSIKVPEREPYEI